jgi:glycosyltransferase involved in cell wall biosynthesis
LVALADKDNSKVAGLISVIMPCYNAAAFIEQAIKGVLQQSYTNVELIVIDDGSSDESITITERLASRHPQKITILHQDHKGPYPARNLGLGTAQGEFIAFLDADDWWREDCLKKLHNAISSYNADLSYCGWQNIGKPDSGCEPYIPPKYEDQDIAEAFLHSCPWPIHAALVRHDVIDAIDGFSERRFSAMDYDFWLRIFGHTKKMVQVPQVMAFYRWHDKGQISANKSRQVIDAFAVRKDFVSNHSPLVAHLPRQRLWALTHEPLLKEAYTAFWKRDLLTAQRLFRYAFTHGIWKKTDLKYILPSLLPGPIYRFTINTISQIRGGRPV